MARPTWDDTHFAMLHVIAQRATCPRLHTAACLVDEHNRVIASGYNGSVRGLPHCDDVDVGCLIVDHHCKRTIHAELNCIINAARTRSGTVGTKMYCLHTPCMDCAKYIVQAGIVEVHCYTYYDNLALVDFLQQAGVQICTQAAMLR